MDHSLKDCEHCRNTIPKRKERSWPTYRLLRFCSLACSTANQSKKLAVQCAYCGVAFERSPSHVRGPVHYCSRKCKSDAKTVEKDCMHCGVRVRRPQSQSCYDNFYCSQSCQGAGKRKNTGQSQGRRSPEDLAWKKEVLRRGGYVCALCGTNKRLEAHHTKPIKDFPELRHDPENGQCVCHDCHYYKIHGGAPNFKHGRYAKKRKV